MGNLHDIRTISKLMIDDLKEEKLKYSEDLAALNIQYNDLLFKKQVASSIENADKNISDREGEESYNIKVKIYEEEIERLNNEILTLKEDLINKDLLINELKERNDNMNMEKAVLLFVL